MPYKSQKQAAYMHIHHPEIAARWDAEYGGKKKAKKKRVISKARRDYAPAPLEARRMDDEALARAKDRQKYFSLTGSGLGITGLGLLGTGAAVKGHNPRQAARLKNYAANTSITAGGIGALSGINFARIQGEESKRAREIKKSNYGAGYSRYYSDPADVEGVPARTAHSDKNWKKKSPYTISRRAADPERSRERRARTYPVLMGGGAAGAGALAAREAGKEKNKSKFFDKKILNSKTLRVGVPVVAAGGLAAGAAYNVNPRNRKSYEGEWYPKRERQWRD